ncbi:MAG: STAS domain-containing protein [Planctomycetes bacterium]|nr:STAS domain-containing protein [Planctomycetota bacterium]
MTDLRFDITPIDALANTARVVVEGAIDATTVISFESQLKQLQEDGYTNFVLDMQGIKYVNSTGLGSLVATADNLEKVGGGLALIRVHPKVKVVFDMLGLNSFFRIFTNEDEAVNFLATSKGGEAAAPAAPQHAPAQQQQRAPAQQQQQRQPTGQYQQPGYGQPQQQQRGAPPQQVPQQQQRRQTSVVQQQQFQQQRPPTGQYQQRPGTGQWSPPSRDNPQVVACPNCGASFKVSQTGRYKCPSCATAFVVDPQFGVELAPATSQLTLAFTPECREGFNLYLGAMCRRAGYSEQDYNGLRAGLDQVLQGVLQNCYQGRIYESYAVAFLPARRNLQIKFIVAGPTLQGDPRAYFPQAAQQMPDLAMRPHPKGGTVIVMSFRR